MSASAGELDSRIEEVLRLGGQHTMEHLLRKFPDVTWAQVFSSVDRLSRSGKVVLQQTPYRDYLVSPRASFLPASLLTRTITSSQSSLIHRSTG